MTSMHPLPSLNTTLTSNHFQAYSTIAFCFHLTHFVRMPRTIQRAPIKQVPRRQLACKAARKSAPSTGGIQSYSPSRAARKSAPSSGPVFRTEEEMEAWLQADMGSDYASSSSIIDLTGSPPPTANIPPSHAITDAKLSLVSAEVQDAIATVSEQHLRSAILKACSESAEAAKLVGSLLSSAALGTSIKKRKRGPEICGNCEGEIDDDGDGCCKWRRMDLVR